MIEIEAHVTKGRPPITLTVSLNYAIAEKIVTNALLVNPKPLELIVMFDRWTVCEVAVGPVRAKPVIIVDFISGRVGGTDYRSVPFKRWIRRHL